MSQKHEGFYKAWKEIPEDERREVLEVLLRDFPDEFLTIYNAKVMWAEFNKQVESLLQSLVDQTGERIYKRILLDNREEIDSINNDIDTMWDRLLEATKAGRISWTSPTDLPSPEDARKN
jgi:hypothetical protein